MLKYIDLLENPIGDIDFLGDMDSKGSLDWHLASEKERNVRKLVTSPAHQYSVRRMFRNTPFNIDIVYFNRKWDGNVEQSGEGIKGMTLTPLAFKRKFKVDLDVNPSSITFVITNNLGGQNIPLTPWMIAHRLGHAIIESDSDPKRIWENTASVFREVAYALIKNDAEEGRSTRNRMAGDLCRVIGTTKAFRDWDGYATWGEWMIDSFAQYLITGSIKILRTSEARETNSLKIDRNANFIALDKKLADTVAKIEDYYEEILAKRVGKIMVL